MNDIINNLNFNNDNNNNDGSIPVGGLFLRSLLNSNVLLNSRNNYLNDTISTSSNMKTDINDIYYNNNINLNNNNMKINRASVTILLRIRSPIHTHFNTLEEANNFISHIPYTQCEVLLIQRAKNEKDRYSGDVGLPGGRREEIDKNDYETAIRECKEEIGYDISNSNDFAFIGSLPPKKITFRRSPMIISPFVFLQMSYRPIKFIPDPNEVSQCWWSDFGSIIESSQKYKEKLEINTFRYFRYLNKKPWRYFCKVIGMEKLWFPCISLNQPEEIFKSNDNDIILKDKKNNIQYTNNELKNKNKNKNKNNKLNTILITPKKRLGTFSSIILDESDKGRILWGLTLSLLSSMAIHANIPSLKKLHHLPCRCPNPMLNVLIYAYYHLSFAQFIFIMIFLIFILSLFLSYIL